MKSCELCIINDINVFCAVSNCFLMNGSAPILRLRLADEKEFKYAHKQFKKDCFVCSLYRYSFLCKDESDKND